MPYVVMYESLPQYKGVDEYIVSHTSRDDHDMALTAALLKNAQQFATEEEAVAVAQRWPWLDAAHTPATVREVAASTEMRLV